MKQEDIIQTAQEASFERLKKSASEAIKREVIETAMIKFPEAENELVAVDMLVRESFSKILAVDIGDEQILHEYIVFRTVYYELRKKYYEIYQTVLK